MLRRIAGLCGIASPLVGLTALLVAISRSPWFSWTENHISVLGVDGSATALFNRGLMLTGVLSLIFALGLGRSLPFGRSGRVAIVCLILGSMALAALGVFPRTIDLPHNLATIAFLVFIALALLLIGVAALAASRTVPGLLSLAAGLLMVIIQPLPWPWSGGAIPQLLAYLPWAVWTIVFGVGLLLRTGPVEI